MPEPSNPCPGRKCGVELRDEFLCSDCAARAVRAAKALPALRAELETTIARQDRSSGRGGSVGRGGESKLPINLNALAQRNHEQIVVAFACELGYVLDTFDLTGAVDAIIADPMRLQMAIDGPAFAKAIHRAASEWRHTVDRHDDRVYAGPCNECRSEMYARIDSDTVRCPGCRAEYTTSEQRQWVLEQVRDTLWPIRLIRAALGNWLGVKVNDSTVRSWRKRQRLVPKGVNADNEDTYRVGDYLDLAESLRPLDLTKAGA